MLYLENAAWIWVPFLIIFTLAAWFFMNDLSASKASLSEQLPVLKRLHLWIMALLYLDLRLLYRLFRRVRDAVKNSVPGYCRSCITPSSARSLALARSMGRAISTASVGPA